MADDEHTPFVSGASSRPVQLEQSGLHAEIASAWRGIPAHHVAAALTECTPGVNWSGCSKAYIIEQFVAARVRRSQATHPRLAEADVQSIARKARARAGGAQDWSLTP